MVHMTTQVETFYDEKTGMRFKASYKMILDRYTVQQINQLLHQELNKDYIGFGTHEQYFYPGYYNYQPNYREKIETALRIMHESQFQSVFFDEILQP